MKKTTLLTMAVVAAVSLTANAQAPGPWDVTGGIAQTTTPHQVQIGAGAGAINAWTDIHYCNDQDYGLVITKEDCGYYVLDPKDQQTATWDGVISPVEPSGGGAIFTVPINFSLTAYNSSLSKPMIWARQENFSTFTNTSGAYTSRMIVTPYGRSGFNIENPRAALDIKSLGAWNIPAVIIGRQKPGTVDKTQHVHFVPLLDENGYNQITHKNDQGLFFTDGQGIAGANIDGAFVIAPWANDKDPAIGGLRITKQGNLEVAGEVTALQVNVETQWWSDFVFGDKYYLMSILDVEKYIKEKKHLPGVPSEKEVLADGINVTEMFAIHMQKIEELTLYTIEQEKKIQKLETMVKELIELNKTK